MDRELRIHIDAELVEEVLSEERVFREERRDPVTRVRVKLRQAGREDELSVGAAVEALRGVEFEAVATELTHLHEGVGELEVAVDCAGLERLHGERRSVVASFLLGIPAL